MLRWPRGIVLGLGLMACGADESEPAVLGALCGVDGPFRLVALEPDQVLRSGFQRIDDRYYYTIARRRTVGGTTGDVENTLWSIGTCGEAPRRLAEGVTTIFTDAARWPGVLLGCRTTRDLVSFDLAGVEPPHVVFTDIDCRAERTDHGFLAVEGADDDPAALILYPYPVDARRDAPEPRVLLSPTVSPQYPIIGDLDARLSVHEDTAHVLTTDGQLLSIELSDGVTTVEQSHVRNFYISPEGRYLLYQDLTVTNGGTGLPAEGLVILRDRMTGESAALGAAWLHSDGYSLDFTNLGFMTLTPTIGSADIRVFFLPDLDFVDLPEGLTLLGQIADGRWLMQAWWGGGPIYLGDLRDPSSPTRLFGDAAVLPTEARPDGITVVAAGGCCHPYEWRDEGGVWFVPFDGSAPRRLAERATASVTKLDAHRLITAINIDEELADLVLVDTATGVEQRIDRRVEITPDAPVRLLEGDTYFYPVVDGERSGIWLVRPPPTR